VYAHSATVSSVFGQNCCVIALSSRVLSTCF
jgi:hypothetical protein